MEDALSSALAPAAYPPERNPMPKARKTQCAYVLIACRRCHLKPACEEPPPTSALHFRRDEKATDGCLPQVKAVKRQSGTRRAKEGDTSRRATPPSPRGRAPNDDPIEKRDCRSLP